MRPRSPTPSSERARSSAEVGSATSAAVAAVPPQPRSSRRRSAGPGGGSGAVDGIAIDDRPDGARQEDRPIRGQDLLGVLAAAALQDESVLEDGDRERDDRELEPGRAL